MYSRRESIDNDSENVETVVDELDDDLYDYSKQVAPLDIDTLFSDNEEEFRKTEDVRNIVMVQGYESFTRNCRVITVFAEHPSRMSVFNKQSLKAEYREAFEEMVRNGGFDSRTPPQRVQMIRQIFQALEMPPFRVDMAGSLKSVYENIECQYMFDHVE
jgi:hypothetical protein